MKFKKLIKNYQKGFTLIELLVVVSIISLLSSIILGQIQNARNKAEITKFIQEINQIQKALELYKTNKGEYPIDGMGAGVPVSLIISNYLLPESIFSKNITIPKFILNSGFSVFKNIKYYYNNDNYSQSYYTEFFNCGASNLPQHRYIITIFSNKNLPFKRLYYDLDDDGGINPFSYQGYNGYCISSD